jgi:superfamily II DNA or RNA helicase
MNFIENNNQTPKTIYTYLGQKGYTILKKDLTPIQIDFIKKELTIKPYVMGSPIASTDTYPVYRESNCKFYLPRYFGEQHFGPPKEIKITDGNDINIHFNGELRDYQKPVVEKYLNYVKSNSLGTGGGLLELYCAWGKTSASLYILSVLAKKTLVIVHKEFLLNQWVERINQFLPTARIGRIQGQIIDIDDKDIVICMLQSLSMKNYPQSLFESFGLTIIDEVHHISSEVFSNALFKIITKYMLGLSATMNRKDGTSHVFKMFLGDVVHKAVREDESNDVVVRAIEYEVNDEEFNHIVYDFRGNPQYSTMISKLCEYNYRSEFILKIITDMLNENPNQQIMILAHNKSLLKYLYDAIEHRKISTVGYYVGGMKEEALKISETKKIIIATYSMAAEGLDIKTLTTLIMATPKTDIEQSVGRILRERHSKPVVVDIIDSHDLFQNQWKKRKAFYKKQNYKIIQTSNKNYNPDTTKWDIIFTPGCKITNSKSFEKKEKINKNDPNSLLQGKCLIKIKTENYKSK